MTRIKNFFVKNRLVFLAFIVPVILLLISFAITGIYPFGDQQIAVIDMYHQYLPFLTELQDRLQRGGSLFYSWDGAAGGNFWNLLAYYGASPLNIILLFVPKAFVCEGVTGILVLRLGLAGAFMAIYLRDMKGAAKKQDLAIVAFATCYALCSYVMGYYWCIMWMDAVTLLPLIMLGLKRIIQGRGCVLYTVSLAIVVFSNYYIAIMVCIFIAFFYPVAYFTETKWAGVKKCAMTTAKAVFFSLLAIAMAAVMLYPTYLSMQYTYYIDSSFPDTWFFYEKAMDVINQLLPNTQLTYREGLPNLYSGTMVVILGIFYVLDKTIELKEKSLYLGFLAFIFLSLNINVLNYIWHGFHFPNQLPYRYTFVVSFVLITMAYKAYLHLDQVKINAIWGALAGLMAWMVLSQRVLAEKITNGDLYVYMGVAMVIVYSVLMILYRKRHLGRKAFVILLALAMVCEMGINTTTSFKQVGNTSRDVYFENYEDVENLVALVDDEMCRVEMDDNYILNNPALYHYKGVSQFSSSLNAEATALMEKIGVEGEPGKNRYNYNQTDPVTNAILNIKYLISKNRPIYDPDFAEISQSGDSLLYKSKYPLSIGYMTGNEIWTWDTTSDNPFDVLDDYVRAATGNQCDGVFHPVNPVSVESDNVDLIEDGFGIWQEELMGNTGESVVELTYESSATQKHYVFVEANNCDEIFVSKANVEDDIQIRDDCGSVVNVGVIEEGENFTVRIKYAAGCSGSVTCYVCTMDQQVWDEAYGIISDSVLEVTDFGDNYIKGNVTAKRDGMLVTSIPYESGWTMKVNGKKQSIDQLVGDAFISVPLNEGTYQIEFKFTPPGLAAGAAMTLGSILILIFAATGGAILRRRTKRASKHQPAAEEPEESQVEESDCNKEYIDSYPEEEEEGCLD